MTDHTTEAMTDTDDNPVDNPTTDHDAEGTNRSDGTDSFGGGVR